jgi:hypothetical protein
MDARQIQIFRGAMHLLAHREVDIQLIDDRSQLKAVEIAHQMWHLVEETISAQPHGPVSQPVQLDTAA